MDPTHMCTKCNRIFANERNLEQHALKNSCKNVTCYCKICGKGFSSESSMYRHMRTICKVKKENEKNNDDDKYEQLEKKFEKKLEQKYEELIKEFKTKSIKCEKNNNVIINNGTINNIIMVKYGNEDMARFSKSEILNAIKGYFSPIELTRVVHFNKNYPEYHNIYIPNMRDKYAMVYNGVQWNLVEAKALIDTIYEDKKNYFESTIEEFVGSLSLSKMKALERWLADDDNSKKIKEVKNALKLILYNNKNIPLATKKLIE